MESAGVCPRCGTVAAERRWCQMCGLDLESQQRLPTSEEYLAHRRDEQWRAAHEPWPSPWLAIPPVAWVCVALLAAMIAGGFGPWATAFGIVSVNGTRGDGWVVIGAAGSGLALLVLWLRRRERWWLLIALWACGLIGTSVAGFVLNDLRGNGEQELFGERVSLVSPAWGIYAALSGSALLALAATVLLIDALRRRRGVGMRALVGVIGALAVLNAAGGIVLAAAPIDQPDRGDTRTDVAPEHPAADVPAQPAAGVPVEPAGDVPAAPEGGPPATALRPEVTGDEVQGVLDLYAAAYDAEDATSLAALFAPGFERRSDGEAPQDRQAALAVYRKQFAQIENPQYVLSHVEVRQASGEGASADARYAITSETGTVRGSITFDLVREDNDLRLAALEILPD